MAKRRLTLQQKRRVRDRQEQLWEDRALGAHCTGRVRARLGRHAEVEPFDAAVPVRCHLRSNLEDIVCGDEVVFEYVENGQGVILSRNERRTELARPGPRGDARVLAANLDILLVVSAPEPPPDPRIIDQYLVAAEHAGITPALVFNKSDLCAMETPGPDPEVAGYGALGYPVVTCSARSGAGLDGLLDLVGKKCCACVGQSGVGKSSLVSALAPDADVTIGDLSATSGAGTHTTTTTRSYWLPGGGLLIDSPGIREFPLLPMDRHDLERCFVEFRPHLGACRFRDCRHRDEPGCAIVEAARGGEIAARRLESFHAFAAGMEESR